MGIAGEALQQALLLGAAEGQVEVEAVDEGDRPMPACINTALHQLMTSQRLRRQLQPAAHGGAELSIRVIQG